MADVQMLVKKTLNQASNVRLALLAPAAVIASVFLAAGWSSNVWAQAKTAPAKTSPAKTAAASDDTAQVGSKVGFVNTQRILLDSAPAKVAQEKIDAEFEKRNVELQKLVDDLRKRVQAFEKDAPVLAESDRNRRQRELGNLDADVQRKQREIQEDFNRRRNEEFSIIIERANAAIKKIAESENYDLILQDAVTVSPRVDITDKVIKALN
jgi:outer membrane protein